MLLSWLNLHDRPAVQVEALLALTNFAELCAKQASPQSTAVAAAAQAAVSAVKGGSSPNWNEAVEAASKYAPGKYPYQGLMPGGPGSVPFPPLSFSQTLPPEAVAAFDASLASTIKDGNTEDNKEGWNSTLLSNMQNALGNSAGMNFSALAPTSGGSHSTASTNSFLPPPTPVGLNNSSGSFPQQLSASSQHLLLRHADAIPTLISLLSSPSKDVYEQAMWILGSIAAGDSPTTASSTRVDGKSVSARDVILAAGVMNQLLTCLEAHTDNLGLQRIGSWTLSNLVDGIFQQSHGKNSGSGQSVLNFPGTGANSKTGAASDYVSSDEIQTSTLLPVLRRLLRSVDAEVLGYTCWTLSHLCDGPSSHIAAVVTTPRESNGPTGGLVPRLVELLLHSNWRVTKPALRTIGNIVCAECNEDANGSTTTDYTEVILECNAVPRLKELVTHSNREIQKEACWTLSNIAAGTVDQIQAVIDSGAIVPLVRLVRDSKTDSEVRSEACWVVLNATSCGSDSQIEVLVDEGCVAVLGVLLSEATMVMMALEGLERVLQVEETREMLRQEQIDSGDIEDEEENRTPTLVDAALIEKARDSHSSSAVTKRAERIWKQHFVSCALCKKSYSKHRAADASFCEECKCYVCSNCNCRVYHLDYQEELWAATEEKTEAKKSAKSKKNRKKKEKLKQRKSKKLEEPEPNKEAPVESVVEDTPSHEKDSMSTENLNDQKEEEDDEKEQIDFVLYLQQTGSVIALAKLMDALEGAGDDYHDELDDYERKMIQEQQFLRQEASSQSAH